MSARQYGDILQHFFSSVAEAGGFDRHGIEYAFELIDDKSGKRVAFHVFGNNQKSGALLSERLDYGQNLLKI